MDNVAFAVVFMSINSPAPAIARDCVENNPMSNPQQ
jgi:hypothetical protein